MNPFAVILYKLAASERIVSSLLPSIFPFEKQELPVRAANFRPAEISHRNQSVKRKRADSDNRVRRKKNHVKTSDTADARRRTGA